MRLVHHQNRLEPLARIGDLLEWRQVAIHREDRIRRHQDTPGALLPSPPHRRFQRRNVTVRVDLGARPREPAAVHQAGVVQRVREHDVLGSCEGRHHAAVGRVAGVEEHRPLGAFESGQFLLERVMREVVAADKPAGARAGAPLRRAFGEGVADGGMRGEPQVVVRAEVDEALSRGKLHLGAGARAQRLEGAQQPVGGDRDQLLPCQCVGARHRARLVRKRA